MSIENEFVTVDLVASAGVATSGIDAFALSVIKGSASGATSKASCAVSMSSCRFR